MDFKKLLTLAVSGVVLGILFQNCGRGGFEALSLSSLSSPNSSEGQNNQPSSGQPPAGQSGTIQNALKCVSTEPAQFSRRVWRLTGEQYLNSLRAAFPTFPATTAISNPFLNDGSTGHFNNNSDGLRLSSILTASLVTSAENFASVAAPLAVKNFSCLSQTLNATCANQVVNALGKSLFRRPLSATEVSDYSSFFMTSNSQYSGEGLAMLIQALVMSPNFLYRYEVGDAATGVLSAYEKASLISYAAANTSPDEELMTAAQNNALQTADQIKKQFLRLAKKSGRYETSLDFLRQYLDYDGIVSSTKEASLFPDFSSQVAQSMVKETDALVVSLLQSGQGSFKEMLSTKSAMVSRETASYYGVSASNIPAGQMMAMTIADGSRAGLLTQPSFLASMGAKNRTSPVHLGAKIRNALLCSEVPPPPLNVPSLDTVSEEFVTQRARLKVHTTQPACYACHKFMDPLGLGFEGYDSVGKVRTTEGGMPVDDSGEVLLTSSPLDGPFRGGVQLSQRMSDSYVVQACFLRNSSKFLTGSYTIKGGDCFIKSIVDSLGDPKDLSMVETFANIYSQFLTLPRTGTLTTP